MARSEAASRAQRIAPRSSLRQERSRLRQQALLDAAEALIAELGLDQISMREVGRRAGLPIASVYHYFPSAVAIVRELALRQLSRISSIISAKLESWPPKSLESREEIATFAMQMIDEVAAYLIEAPGAVVIWNALRSNRELRALDRIDTAATARILAPYLAPILPSMLAENRLAFSVVLLETVAVNLVYAIECSGRQRTVHLQALRHLISATINGLG